MLVQDDADTTIGIYDEDSRECMVYFSEDGQTLLSRRWMFRKMKRTNGKGKKVERGRKMFKHFRRKKPFRRWRKGGKGKKGGKGTRRYRRPKGGKGRFDPHSYQASGVPVCGMEQYDGKAVAMAMKLQADAEWYAWMAKEWQER